MDNHSKFLSHLDESIEAVFIGAHYLHKLGYTVKINALKKAKEHKHWKNNVDNGDLAILSVGKWRRIEVKGLSVDFTGKKDWPFGDKFIVCAKHSYDMADPKPYAYIIFNKNKTHVAIIKGWLQKYWYVETKTDSRYENVSQEFYMCPLNKVIWEKII